MTKISFAGAIPPRRYGRAIASTIPGLALELASPLPSTWIALNPHEALLVMAFVADVEGQARVDVRFEQAMDNTGAGAKGFHSSAAVSSLPQRLDGEPLQFMCIATICREELDEGHAFVRCTLDVLFDGVITGAFLLRLTDDTADAPNE